MLKLLRRLVSHRGAKRGRAIRPTAATSKVLARRAAPARAREASDGIAFDPYNTGVFDRSASWERVSKRDY